MNKLSFVMCCIFVSQLAPAGTGNIDPDRNVQNRTEIAETEITSPPAQSVYFPLDSRDNKPSMRLAQTSPVAEGTTDYREAAAREAAQSDVIQTTPFEQVVDNPPENTAATQTPNPNGTRIDAIRNIVSEALAIPEDQKTEPKAEQTEPPQIKQQRQRLREAVSSAPTPTQPPGDNYLSILKDEVSTTYVLEEKEYGTPQEAPVAGPGTTGQQAAATETYTVRNGDSLWNIAVRTFGNGHLWTVIYESNRHTINNANVLKVGQILRIPRN